MKRKFTALLMALLLILATFGCSSDSDKGDEIRVRLRSRFVTIMIKLLRTNLILSAVFLLLHAVITQLVLRVTVRLLLLAVIVTDSAM